MTTDKPKSQAKTAQLRRADLNFISNYPLEHIREALQQHADKQTSINVVLLDDDTALFSITRYRKGKLSATVNGRMKRWAGDMTHIYCDGRSFDQRHWWREGIRYGLAFIFGAPMILFGLSLIIGSPNWLSFLFLWSLIITIFTTIFGGLGLFFYMLVRSLMQSDTFFIEQAASKPAAKDRERLLHILTNIIADTSPVKSSSRLAVQDTNPLSDDEILALINKASLRFTQS